MPPKLAQNPLLAILRGGKQTQLPQQSVQFGVPTAAPTFPTALPQTANTTRQAVQLAPLVQPPQMTPIPAPVINPLDIIRRGKEQVISQPAPQGLTSRVAQDLGGTLKTIAGGDLSPLGSPGGAGKAVGKFAFNIPNYIMAGFVGAGRTIMEETLPRIIPGVTRESLREDFDKSKGIDEWLLKGEVNSWQEVKKQMQDAIDKSPNALEWEKKYLPLSVAVAGFAMDASGFGKPATKGLTNKVLADLAGQTDAKTISSALLNAGAPQDVVNIATPLVVRATTPEQVQNALVRASESVLDKIPTRTDVSDDMVLENMARLKVDPMRVPPDDFARFEDLGKQMERRPLTPDEMAEAKAIVERVDGKLPSPEVGAMDIKKPAPVKAQDPKNFKTAEEYVGAQGLPVYRGGALLDENRIKVDGVSFTKNKEVADSFLKEYRRTRNRLPSGVEERYISPNARILPGKDIPKKFLNRKDTTTDSFFNELATYSRKMGYDGVDLSIFGKRTNFDSLLEDEIRIVNPKVIKTRTQLIDEWKRAQPVNKKLADFRDGKSSSEAGFVANPFKVTDKGVIPTSPRVPNAGNPAAFDAAANGLLRDSWTKLREVVQDNWIRAKNLQRTPGVKVEKGANPYLAETLFHGRVHTRLQQVKDTVIKIDKDIVSNAKKLNTPSEELTRTVNKYLQATHAPERNAKLGDGAAGMTTKEADDFIASVNASSLGKEVKRVSDELIELNRRTLTTLKEAQVIDEDTFKVLTETYKNHVPLQRILDTTEDITQALSGRGFSVKGSGIKRAKGSKREVADIITNITTNVEQAIIRAEKNMVDLQTLKFARNNKDLGLFEEIKPKVMGLDFSGKPISQQVTDPQVLTLRENGKPVYLKINDPHMAAMYQNVNLEHIPNMMQWIATFTRLYSSLHTRFNYEFAFSNKVRDIQEMAVDMASRKEMGFKQAGKAITNEPESIKSVTDFIRGKDTEGARLYKQLQEDGGTTGGLSLSTRKQVEVDIEKIRQINRSQPRKAARMLLEAIDNWNTIFEDSTRLSVYKTALKNGLDRETAAMLAKESTVNFNKKGTGGSVINGLYMFSNASIQGSTKMLRAMKNPKVAGAVVGGMGLAVYNLNKFNDSVDPDWRDKVTEFDRTSNFVIFLPSDTGEARYIAIPVSWGLKPLKVGAEHANDLMTGHNDSVPDAVRGIMVSAATAYNPLAGSESVVETLTPTFLKTPQEITSNTAWHGGKIRPDYDPNMPKSAQFFGSLERKATGRVAIDATEKLADATGGEIQISPANVNYAFEAYIGGLGRSVTKILNTITSIGKGEELKASEIPIFSRFLKVRDTEQTETSRIYGVLDEQRKERSQGVYDADRLFRDLKELPSEEQKARLKEIAVEDPDLLKQLETRYKKDRWTPQERALAGLTNASKAQYLLTRLPEIPREERRQYITELLERGVISENVIKEMETQRGIITQ